jgi:hypothetical protein
MFVKTPQDSELYPYYLSLPSTVRVVQTSPEYGFVSFIAEVSGWYNLFLGGSILALWEVMGTGFLWTLARIEARMANQVMLRGWKFLFLMISSGILIYILIDCITTLVENPIGTSTLLTSAIPAGLSLSICLPRYTSAYDPTGNRRLTDVANTTDFWVGGTNLSNKIADLSIMGSDGGILARWNRTQPARNSSLFNIINMMSDDTVVEFCHSVDLSTLPGRVSRLQLRAVNDVTLAVHLAGQLLATEAKYVVANKDTVQFTPARISLYGSEVSLQLQATSFLQVSSEGCEYYNNTWTFDDCALESALGTLGVEGDTLRGLMRPKNMTYLQGVDQMVLKRLYNALLSKEIQTKCRPACVSLVITMRSEDSPVIAQPQQGLRRFVDRPLPLPLPPLQIEVNLTLPDLSTLNEVSVY